MAPSNLRREITNAPNLVTMGRVVVIPLVLFFMDNYNPLRSFIAALLWLVAAAGDFRRCGSAARARSRVDASMDVLARSSGRRSAAVGGRTSPSQQAALAPICSKLRRASTRRVRAASSSWSSSVQ